MEYKRSFLYGQGILIFGTVQSSLLNSISFLLWGNFIACSKPTSPSCSGGIPSLAASPFPPSPASFSPPPSQPQPSLHPLTCSSSSYPAGFNLHELQPFNAPFFD
eukprot:scaffold186305_cov22-Tisochrysis_lutea.AAC.1